MFDTDALRRAMASAPVVTEGYPGSEAEKREAEQREARARIVASVTSKARVTEMNDLVAEMNRRTSTQILDEAFSRIAAADRAGQAAAEPDAARRVGTATAALEAQRSATARTMVANAMRFAREQQAAQAQPVSIGRQPSQDAQNEDVARQGGPSGTPARDTVHFPAVVFDGARPDPSAGQPGTLGPIRWSALPDLLPGDRYAEHDPVPPGAVFVGHETMEAFVNRGVADRGAGFWGCHARSPDGRQTSQDAELVAVFRLPAVPGSARLCVAAKPAGSIQFRAMEFFEVDPVGTPITAEGWRARVASAVRAGATLRVAETQVWAAADALGFPVDRAMVSAVRFALEQAAEAERRAALPDPAGDARVSRDAAVTRAVSRDAVRGVSGWGTP